MTNPRITPPGCCSQCGASVVQIFLAYAPSNQYSYVCDAEPVAFLEGKGNDFVIDEYGKIHRGVIAVDAAKSTADDRYFTIHTPTCAANIRKQGGVINPDPEDQLLLGGEGY